MLFSISALPWETNDQMGRTWSKSNGTFTISGCGADVGPYNTPDPYIIIQHQCPSTVYSTLGSNGTTTRTKQFAVTKVFLPKILNIGKIFLDDSDFSKFKRK